MPNWVNVPVFSPRLYGYRNLVKHLFGVFKHFGSIAVRFAKCDANFLGIVKLAAA